MKMHIHDCYEIYYSISGGKQFLIANKHYSINPGDLFVINQYESHYLTQIDQEIHERIIISIHPDFIKETSSILTDLSYCFTHRPQNFCHKLSLSKEQQQLFLYYINKIVSSNGYGHDLLEKSTFTELMTFLNSCYHETPPAPSENTLGLNYNKQMDDILNYINLHITQPLTIDHLSTQFFLSKSYICRIFKLTTGMTINKYITARRISIAKSLLADGLSVNTVCEQCGYNDYSNFVKAFTKAVGLPPKKYAQCLTILPSTFSNQ